MTKIPYAMAVGNWLPYSETFIYDQVKHAKDFSPLVLTRGLNPAREMFPYDHVISLSAIERALYYAALPCGKFAKAIREWDARFIHAHFGTNGALIEATARKTDRPLIVTFHGVDVGILMNDRIPLDYLFYKRVYRRMFESAQLMLPASQELAECLVKLGAPAHKIRIHRLGVDVSAFTPYERPDRPAQFLMIGRQVEKKGFEYGIRAFAKIAGKFPGSTLTLVGKGPLMENLQALAAELRISDKVIFKGSVPAKEMPALMADYDVLVAPCIVAGNNDRDSGLIVLKEAGASAMASIGTFCGGLPEIIDNGNSGFLVGQHEVDSLAESMEALASSYSLRIQMGKAARLKMEQEYDTVRQNAALEEIFKTII
ncbi:MAG: glycosyltransferase [Fibrobacter sp.]|nr:glycosyltransferase [Fibrobacter sp.]